MSRHTATIRWSNSGGDFIHGKYSREHTWSFDGGITIQASSSPAAVPKPFSNEACVDPEEAFVASLSSCHMLTYLFLASKAGFAIATYQDEAVGVLTKNERGIPWVSSVVLRPRVVYSGDKQPTDADHERLHHAAHDNCFIANSVKTEVRVEWK